MRARTAWPRPTGRSPSLTGHPPWLGLLPGLGGLSARLTNLTLLGALVVAFGTGAGAMATGSPRGRWIVILHGIGALAVVLLVPAKARVIRRGLRRPRAGRWFSSLLAALTVVTLLAGFGYSSGLVRSVAGVRGMWLHVAAALALVPLACWHLLARRARPRRTDLSRRTLLRTGAIGAVSAGLYAASAGALALARLPGARRRFTGSYLAGSLDPAAMPETIWLDDRVPEVDPQAWRLVVVDALGRHEYTLPELSTVDSRVRAVLDCTSGWYAWQDWSGVPVSALLRGTGNARSLLVGSVTGYSVRLPVADAGRLLLATGAGGAPLSVGHGFPLRLVAPGRRGFWWVKWVNRIEVRETPWWWQSPFPLT